MTGRLTKLRKRSRQWLARRGFRVERLSEQERVFLTEIVDTTTPLPRGATQRLRDDHPRLLELRHRYETADPAVAVRSSWHGDRLNSWLDLRHFRGDNSYVWHYREDLRVTELKFLVFAQDVRSRDHHGLLDRLVEDGSFGCWTYQFDGMPLLSRDLLDSVNELLFLDRHLGALDGTFPRVLDIGAGYGRMAHRYVVATKNTEDYCCVDAVAESTFLCEYHLEHHGLDAARVVELNDVDDLAAGQFDLALNIHSWSECPLSAIEWWVSHLSRLEIPRLFLVPNEADGFLSLEPDWSRRDYLPLIEAAGYRTVVDEPAFADPATRAALEIEDRHYLFELA